MPIDQTPLPERVANYYSLLSTAAKDLNSISDELGKSIAEVDLALKKLNLGVVVWVSIRNDEGNPDESWYWTEDIGYAKIGSNWGISLRKIAGDLQRPDEDTEERWLFNDAPRALRISAIDKIPELLEKLSTEAAKTTKEIRARLRDVQAVAEAMKGVPGNAKPANLRLSTPAQVSAQSNPNPPDTESLRLAVISALADGGHATAAQLLGAGVWSLDANTLRIEVAGMGKKMLALTINAVAEKIIRQELQSLGAPTRFVVVPREPLDNNTGPKPNSALSQGVEK